MNSHQRRVKRRSIDRFKGNPDIGSVLGVAALIAGKRCTGPKCGARPGENHSLECIALHEKVVTACADEPAYEQVTGRVIRPNAEAVGKCLEHERGRLKASDYLTDRSFEINGCSVWLFKNRAGSVTGSVNGRKTKWAHMVAAIINANS